MIACSLPEVGDCMNHLLRKDTFDHFCCLEATIATGNTVHIDGTINKEYYSKEELEEKQEYQTWDQIKPLCYQLIKGTRVPLSFKLTLGLTKENIANVLAASKLPYTPEQVQGLLMHLRYEKGALSLVTGTSLTVFTLDKTLEQEWDALTLRFLKKHNIISTQL